MTSDTAPDYLSNLRIANADLASNQQALVARYGKTKAAFEKIGLGENIIISLRLGDDFARIVEKNDAEVARLMLKKDAEVAVWYGVHTAKIAKHNREASQGLDLRKRVKAAMTFEAFAKKFGDIPLPR